MNWNGLYTIIIMSICNVFKGLINWKRLYRMIIMSICNVYMTVYVETRHLSWKSIMRYGRSKLPSWYASEVRIQFSYPLRARKLACASCDSSLK